MRYAYLGMNPIYRTEPYQTTADTKLLQIQRKENGEWLLLFEDMLFYPGGGGQPCDRGIIHLGNHLLTVMGFEKHKGDVWVLTREVEDDLSSYRKSPARMELNWEYRYQAMKMHTVQHALGAAMRLELGGYETRGMTILPDLSRCEMRFISYEIPSERSWDQVYRLTQSAIESGLPVEAVYLNSTAEAQELFGEILRMDPRLTEHKGRVRVVVINPGKKLPLQDASPCGGTHLRFLNEAKAFELLECQPGEGKNEWVLSFTVSSGSK